MDGTISELMVTAVKGAQTIDNFDLYFDDRGYQIKGSLVNIGEQTYYLIHTTEERLRTKRFMSMEVHSILMNLALQ